MPITSGNTQKATGPEAITLSTGITNFQNLNSYTYDLKMGMTIKTSGNQTGSVVMQTTSNGGADKSAKTMVMKIMMNATLEGADDPNGNTTTPQSESQNYDLYELGDTAYTRTAAADTGEKWSKYSIADPDKAFSIDVVKQQMRILDSPTDIQNEGSETINGSDCYKLSVIPDMDAVVNYLNSQQSGTDYSQILDFKDALKSCSILCWVGKDNNLLMRVSISINVEYSLQQVGFSTNPDDQATTDIVMDLTMNNINEPFSVTLPPEANSAADQGSITL